MTRLLTDSREFYALVFTVPFVLLGITLSDFLITDSILKIPLEGPSLSTYWTALAVVVAVAIVPLLGLVWFLKNDVSALVVWSIALVVPLISGSEDLMFYGIVRSEHLGTWAAWPWLDVNPAIAWTDAIFGTPEVTLNGAMLAAFVGWVVVAITVYVYFEVLE